jgi:hypothetical protein
LSFIGAAPAGNGSSADMISAQHALVMKIGNSGDIDWLPSTGFFNVSNEA